MTGPTYLYALTMSTPSGGKYWRCYNGGDRLVIEYGAIGKRPATTEIIEADCKNGSIPAEAFRRAEKKRKEGYEPDTAATKAPSTASSDATYYGSARWGFSKDTLRVLLSASAILPESQVLVVPVEQRQEPYPITSAEQAETLDLDTVTDLQLFGEHGLSFIVNTKGEVSLRCTTPTTLIRLLWMGCQNRTLVQRGLSVHFEPVTQVEMISENLTEIAETLHLRLKPLSTEAFSGTMKFAPVF